MDFVYSRGGGKIIPVRMATSNLFPFVVRESFENMGLSGELGVYSGNVLHRFASADRYQTPAPDTYPAFRTTYPDEVFNKAVSVDGSSVSYELFRHLGDLALFLCSVFPDYIRERGSRSVYMCKGKEGYSRAASHASGVPLLKPVADIYRGLVDDFERCVDAIGLSFERMKMMSADDFNGMFLQIVDGKRIVDDLVRGLGEDQEDVA